MFTEASFSSCKMNCSHMHNQELTWRVRSTTGAIEFSSDVLLYYPMCKLVSSTFASVALGSERAALILSNLIYLNPSILIDGRDT